MRESSDTTCFKTVRAEFYIKHAEKYFILLDLYHEQDTISKAKDVKLQEKNNQLLLAKNTIYSQSNEIDKIQKEKRLWMGLSCASLLGLLFMILF